MALVPGPELNSLYALARWSQSSPLAVEGMGLVSASLLFCLRLTEDELTVLEFEIFRHGAAYECKSTKCWYLMSRNVGQQRRYPGQNGSYCE